MLKEIKERINEVGTYHLQGNGRFSYMGHVFKPREIIAELSNESFEVVKDIGGTVLSFMAGRGFFKRITPLIEEGSVAMYPTSVSHYLEVSESDINARINLLYSLLTGNNDPDSFDYHTSYALMNVCLLLHFNLTHREILETMEIIAGDLQSSMLRTESVDEYIKRLSKNSSIVDKKLLYK